jgi:hypothetical protein
MHKRGFDMSDSTELVTTSDDDERATVGRRGAMARLFALTVGLMTGAAVLQADPASATAGAMTYGALNDAGSNETTLKNSIGSGGNTLILQNNGQGRALYAQTLGPTAAHISSSGGSGNCIDIDSLAVTGIGINLFHGSDGAGIKVERNNSAVAGATIDATSDTSGPVYRATSQPPCGEPLFVGTHHGFGAGMQLTLQSTTSDAHVIDANQNGMGPAISAAITNPASHGNSIKATTNGSGTGGAFYGDGGAHARGATLVSNVAQMRLTPGTLTTHPAGGMAGDLYVDRSNRLWFCKGSTTWHQLA